MLSINLIYLLLITSSPSLPVNTPRAHYHAHSILKPSTDNRTGVLHVPQVYSRRIPQYSTPHPPWPLSRITNTCAEGVKLVSDVKDVARRIRNHQGDAGQ